MAQEFFIKRNDFSPTIRVSLKDALGAYVNLNGASVSFKMQPMTGGSIVSGVAEIFDVTEATVEYIWQGDDTSVSDSYRAEFEVTYADGKVETFPNSSFIRVVITEDIS